MLDGIPPFVLAHAVISLVAPVVCWAWGGPAERFGAGLALWSELIFSYRIWLIGDVYVDSFIEDGLEAAAFGWLAFRSNRWWPFVVAIAAVFSVVVHVLTVVTDISWDAAISARVGLGLLFYVALTAGVLERWLARERPAAAVAVWRRRKVP